MHDLTHMMGYETYRLGRKPHEWITQLTFCVKRIISVHHVTEIPISMLQTWLGQPKTANRIAFRAIWKCIVYTSTFQYICTHGSHPSDAGAAFVQLHLAYFEYQIGNSLAHVRRAGSGLSILRLIFRKDQLVVLFLRNLVPGMHDLVQRNRRWAHCNTRIQTNTYITKLYIHT